MNGLPPEPAVFQNVEYLFVTFRTIRLNLAHWHKHRESGERFVVGILCIRRICPLCRKLMGSNDTPQLRNDDLNSLVYNCIEGVCRASDIEIIELLLGNKKPWSKIQRQPYTQTTTSRELSVTSDGLVREG